jgi:hypothetical protein
MQTTTTTPTATAPATTTPPPPTPPPTPTVNLSWRRNLRHYGYVTKYEIRNFRKPILHIMDIHESYLAIFKIFPTPFHVFPCSQNRLRGTFTRAPFLIGENMVHPPLFRSIHSNDQMGLTKLGSATRSVVWIPLAIHSHNPECMDGYGWKSPASATFMVTATWPSGDG